MQVESEYANGYSRNEQEEPNYLSIGQPGFSLGQVSGFQGGLYQEQSNITRNFEKAKLSDRVNRTQPAWKGSQGGKGLLENPSTDSRTERMTTFGSTSSNFATAQQIEKGHGMQKSNEYLREGSRLPYSNHLQTAEGCKPPAPCHLHSKPKTFYCVICKTLVCEFCKKDKHGQHEVISKQKQIQKMQDSDTDVKGLFEAMLSEVKGIEDSLISAIAASSQPIGQADLFEEALDTKDRVHTVLEFLSRYQQLQQSHTGKPTVDIRNADRQALALERPMDLLQSIPIMPKTKYPIGCLMLNEENTKHLLVGESTGGRVLIFEIRNDTFKLHKEIRFSNLNAIQRGVEEMHLKAFFQTKHHIGVFLNQPSEQTMLLYFSKTTYELTGSQQFYKDVHSNVIVVQHGNYILYISELGLNHYFSIIESASLQTMTLPILNCIRTGYYNNYASENKILKLSEHRFGVLQENCKLIICRIERQEFKGFSQFDNPVEQQLVLCPLIDQQQFIDFTKMGLPSSVITQIVPLNHENSTILISFGQKSLIFDYSRAKILQNVPDMKGGPFQFCPQRNFSLTADPTLYFFNDQVFRKVNIKTQELLMCQKAPTNLGGECQSFDSFGMILPLEFRGNDNYEDECADSILDSDLEIVSDDYSLAEEKQECFVAVVGEDRNSIQLIFTGKDQTDNPKEPPTIQTAENAHQQKKIAELRPKNGQIEYIRRNGSIKYDQLISSMSENAAAASQKSKSRRKAKKLRKQVIEANKTKATSDKVLNSDCLTEKEARKGVLLDIDEVSISDNDISEGDSEDGLISFLPVQTQAKKNNQQIIDVPQKRKKKDRKNGKEEIENEENEEEEKLPAKKLDKKSKTSSVTDSTSGQKGETVSTLIKVPEPGLRPFFQVDVDFELVEPSEAYYHSVKGLLNNFLDADGVDLNLTELADLVLSHVSIGSVCASSLAEDPDKMPKYQKLPEEKFNEIVLKYNQERDVYGFITILNISKHLTDRPCITFIADYLKQKAAKHLTDKAKLAQFVNFLSNKSTNDKRDAKKPAKKTKTPNVGILLNERLINLTPLLIPQLHEQIPDDLLFTQKQDDITDPTEFDYDYLVVMTKFALSNNSGAVKEVKDVLSERLYYRLEDEVLAAESEISFSFKTVFKEEKVDLEAPPEVQYKLVYVVSFKNYVKVLPSFKKFASLA